MANRRTAQAVARASRQARRAWDEAADVWEDFVETGKDWSRELVHGPSLLRAIGPVRGLRVLDVGCGQGYMSRRLASRGASVVGIDWSPAMLAHARRHEAERPMAIRYLRLDARRLGSAFAAGEFDLVVASMSLMDMPDLAPAVRGIARALRRGGRLVFSITHPVNSAEVGPPGLGGGRNAVFGIDQYFDEGPRPVQWRMSRLRRPFDTLDWHRTLESWFRLLRSCGFDVEALAEPRPSAAALRARPGLSASRRFPFFLVWTCRRR